MPVFVSWMRMNCIITLAIRYAARLSIIIKKYKQGIEILRNIRVMVLPPRMIESASNMKSMHRISLLFVDSLNHVPVAYTSNSSALENLHFVSHHAENIVHKLFMLEKNQLHVLYRFSAKTKQSFSTQINLAMPSCDGMGGRYRYQNEVLGGFGQWIELSNFTEMTLDDDTLNGHVVLKTSAPVNFRANPHFSVSQSESGFEKIMQAVTLHLEWPITVHELIITLSIHARKRA